MAVTGKLFGLVFSSLWNKELDFDSDEIKVSLHTATYVPDQDTHQYRSSLSNEIVGTGYTAGGAALASKTVTYTAGTNKHVLDAADVSWPSSTITARTAVVYDNTPATDATRPLICYQQSDADIISTGGTWSLVWAAAGILEITVS